MEKLSSYMPEIIVADRKPEMSNGERPSIWQAALNALAECDIDETVDQFDDQFTFTDHALALELKRKDQLYGYFRKIREFFPESERTDHTLFSSGDVIFSQQAVRKLAQASLRLARSGQDKSPPWASAACPRSSGDSLVTAPTRLTPPTRS
jgi:hypothetical protein